MFFTSHMILPDCINEVLLKERSRFKSASMFYHYTPCLRVLVEGVPGSRWWVLIAISAAKSEKVKDPGEAPQKWDVMPVVFTMNLCTYITWPYTTRSPGPDNQWKLTLPVRSMVTPGIPWGIPGQQVQPNCIHCMKPVYQHAMTSMFAGEGRKFSDDDGGLDLCQLGYHSGLVQSNINKLGAWKVIVSSCGPVLLTFFC